MNLISYHMFKTLIVGWAKENHNFQLFSCKTVVHHLVSVSLVAQFMKCIADIINTLTLEWRCVTLISI